MDLDGSGAIDYTEWALGTATPKDTVLSEKKLRQAFALFDQDSSGRVQFSELKTMLSPLISSHLSEEEWKQLISTLDANHDGQLSFTEFSHLMWDTFRNVSGHIQDDHDVVAIEIK